MPKATTEPWCRGDLPGWEGKGALVGRQASISLLVVVGGGLRALPQP